MNTTHSLVHGNKFESTFTAVVNADDKFMHATKCVVAGWISTFNLDELRDGPVFVY